MKKKIGYLISLLVPGFVKRYLESENDKKYNYSTLCYAQEGEDIILLRYFQNRKRGFFVDVGAHHPTRFSNTFRLYVYGWRGINIDATPGSMEAFRKLRPEDINLETAVSDEQEKLNFYRFSEPALNTFNLSEANKLMQLGTYPLLETITLDTTTLSSILDQHMPQNTGFDLLNIDVEGHGMQVLRSLNWNRYLPEVVLIEATDVLIKDYMNQEEYQFLTERGYQLFAKTYKTAFFSRNQGIALSGKPL